MASLLDAFFGASDADVGARVVGTWNSDFGGGLQLQLLQLLAVLANNETMVLLRDGNRSRGLGERSFICMVTEQIITAAASTFLIARRVQTHQQKHTAVSVSLRTLIQSTLTVRRNYVSQ